MRVSSPMHMQEVNYIIHESVGKEDGQNVKVMTRQYTITRVLCWRHRSISKIRFVSSCLVSPASKIANRRLLEKILSGV